MGIDQGTAVPAAAGRWARLLEGLLWAGLGLALARLVWALLTPAGPLGDWRPAQPRATAPAVDRAVLAQFDPFFRSTPATAGPLAASSLDLTLTGTRLDRASGRGSAIIATPDGVQASYAVGEEVAPGVRLVEVGFDSVTLERGGVREQLFLDQSAPAADGAAMAGLPLTPAGTVADPAVPVVPQAPILPEGLGAAGLSPVIEEGRTVGVRVASPPPALLAAGLRPGEVVRAIDGQPLGSPAQLARLAQSRPGEQVTLTVERDGETVTLTVEDPRP